MEGLSAFKPAERPEDRILLGTRLVAILVLPFLVVAFVILYFFPDDAGRLFAWDIRPRVQAMFAGAGYVSGVYYFSNVAIGQRWHRFGAGFVSIATFATSMLVLTILHWSTFDPGHFPFQVWLAIYIVTPVLVFWAWIRNRKFDDGQPEEDDLVVPVGVRSGLVLFGVVILIVALASFIWPSILQSVWVWKLATPLSARLLAGWLSLLGAGGIAIGRDARWSTWKTGLVSLGLWHALVLVAAVLNPADFSNLLNWYLVVIIFVLVGVAVLYVRMERQRVPKRS